jgi:hypothetical protein
MKVKLTFLDGSSLVLDSVKSIWAVAPNEVEIATFGNDAVRHRNVSEILVYPFKFAEVGK